MDSARVRCVHEQVSNEMRYFESVMDAIGSSFIVKLGAGRMQLICGMMKCAHTQVLGVHIVRLIECERPEVARLRAFVATVSISICL